MYSWSVTETMYLYYQCIFVSCHTLQ